MTGRAVVAAVVDAGHEAVVLARSAGVDLTTGEGLDGALAGVDAVIDVTDHKKPRGARAFFTTAGKNLLDAEKRAGVRHHVALSIVGVDRVDNPYYAAKRDQEELVSNGGVPWTVLRATQFHEFVEQILGMTPGPVALFPRMRSQPVAVREVAAALVAHAAGPPARHAPQLAGPRVEELVELARQFIAARERRRWVLPIRLPGAGGRSMASGGLLPTTSGPRGSQTFDDWLVHRSQTLG
jgi:uncharacterized protein YbjT (DUF2867 family)